MATPWYRRPTASPGAISVLAWITIIMDASISLLFLLTNVAEWLSGDRNKNATWFLCLYLFAPLSISVCLTIIWLIRKVFRPGLRGLGLVLGGLGISLVYTGIAIWRIAYVFLYTHWG